MRISLRILLINFVVVVLIIGSSAIAFHSIMFTALTSQHSKYLLKSANDFVFAYQQLLQKADDEFKRKLENNTDFFLSQLISDNLDFVIETSSSANSKIIRKSLKENVNIISGKFNKNDFLENNPNAIIKKYETSDGKKYFYGFILNSDVINNFSKITGCNISLIWMDSPLEISNENINNQYQGALKELYNNLSKSDSKIITLKTESADIIATFFKPSPVNEDFVFNGFLIFSPLNETADLRSSLKDIFIVVTFAGILLSIILTYLFTDKIRKHISQLMKAIQITKKGNFKSKITVKSKDELGEMAATFNEMIDELEKNEKLKKEYSEFITLINRNPALKEIADAALKKIIKTCGFTIGALYSVDEKVISLTSSFGLSEENSLKKDGDFFNTVIINREIIEYTFNDDPVKVITSLTSIPLKYLIILPVIYNNNVIALLELWAIEKPAGEVKVYLSSIQEQLAIGLTNAKALLQLENLIKELKKLNEDYQKQNLQIKQQNESLLELHAQLKEKADELEVQKEKAEESTKLKSEFLASMSHELRTPMNSILGLTELLLSDGNIHGRDKERLEVVLKSSKRLMSILNDILDLSKIEAGKMEIHEEEILIEEIITEVENTITPLVLKKELNFRIKRNCNTKINIKADKIKITQLLINLLSNAIKFTDKGFVELQVQLAENYLNFEVIDSGIGIPEEDQNLIFEEFRQLDGSTTRKYNGTGLGLAISKKIAALLKATLSIKSEPGKGSIFSFKVPITVSGKKPENTSIINVQTLKKNIKNPILVIDDDPEIRYTIGQYLISKGYKVEFAEDGEKGIELAMKIQPFAITLDVLLPGKDGWTVLKELKENKITKDIPVILLSIIANKNMGYGLGAFEYFIKPISSAQLLTAFTKLENLVNKKIEKIALIDNDESEFDKYKEAFKNENVRIEYIKESELAFSRIRESQPDLIIINLLMPDVDGITLSYRLKSSNETKHIPIIISTERDLTPEEKESLNNIVENITIKSKGHPLDVLKVVRDRIKLQEITSGSKIDNIDKKAEEEENDPEPITFSAKEKISADSEVLIVDDDQDTLFTTNEILESCGYRTLQAKNGKECLKILEEHDPDLILMDIMMPEMDGFQAIKIIKGNARLNKIPVIAFTAKAMIGDKEVILKHGFDDFISKPIDKEKMIEKIEKLLLKINVI